jgi:hypothetical protein
VNLLLRVCMRSPLPLKNLRTGPTLKCRPVTAVHLLLLLKMSHNFTSMPFLTESGEQYKGIVK